MGGVLDYECTMSPCPGQAGYFPGTRGMEKTKGRNCGDPWLKTMQPTNKRAVSEYWQETGKSSVECMFCPICRSSSASLRCPRRGHFSGVQAFRDEPAFGGKTSPGLVLLAQRSDEPFDGGDLVSLAGEHDLITHSAREYRRGSGSGRSVYRENEYTLVLLSI